MGQYGGGERGGGIGGSVGGRAGGGRGGGDGGSLHNGRMSLSPAIKKFRPDELQQLTPKRISTSDVCSYVKSTDLLLWCSVSANGLVGLSASSPYCVLQNEVNELSAVSVVPTICVPS